MECDNPGIGNSQLMGTMDEVKFLRNRRNSLVTLRAEITSSEKAHTVEETRAEQDRHSPSAPLGVMEVLFIWELSSLGPLGDSLLPLSRLCGLVRSCISIDLKTRSFAFDRCTKLITPLFNVLTTWHLLWNTRAQKSHCISFLRLEIFHLVSDFSPLSTCTIKRHHSSYVAKVSQAVFKILPLLV